MLYICPISYLPKSAPDDVDTRIVGKDDVDDGIFASDDAGKPIPDVITCMRGKSFVDIGIFALDDAGKLKIGNRAMEKGENEKLRNRFWTLKDGNSRGLDIAEAVGDRIAEPMLTGVAATLRIAPPLKTLERPGDC